MVLQASLSLPGSPFTLRRGSKASQFSWRKSKTQHGVRGDRQPLVLPYLENLNLPYADDSAAVTPTSEDLCNPQNTHNYLMGRRRLSSASFNSRLSHLDAKHGSRRSSFASYHSRMSYTSPAAPLPDYTFKTKCERNRSEPTHFHWNTSMKNRAAHPLLPEVIVDKSKSDDNVRLMTSMICYCALPSTALSIQQWTPDTKDFTLFNCLCMTLWCCSSRS